MAKRILLTLAVCLGVSIFGSAQRALTRAENDSIAQALAVIWGDHLKSRAERAGEKNGGAEYLKGLTQIIEASAADSSYYAGLRDGAMLIAGIQQIEAMGAFTVDRGKLVLAFQRAAKGRSNGFTPESAQRFMNYIVTAMQADQKVAEDSRKFLENAEKLPGARKGLSGLVWLKTREGDDASPRPRVGVNDVLVRYTGKLYNGKVFDQTHSEKPVRFDLQSLITGFASGVSLMVPGSKYRFFIPADLAYGEPGVPGIIPPNAALEFEVELLEILPHNN